MRSLDHLQSVVSPMGGDSSSASDIAFSSTPDASPIVEQCQPYITRVGDLQSNTAEVDRAHDISDQLTAPPLRETEMAIAVVEICETHYLNKAIRPADWKWILRQASTNASIYAELHRGSPNFTSRGTMEELREPSPSLESDHNDR